MGCCYEPPRCQPRSILPKRIVLPIRIIVLVSLVGNCLYTLLHLRDLTALITLILLIHLVISARALSECKKSVHYHHLLDEFERKIAEDEQTIES